ncbi:MFS transporter [Streptosporangium sp. NPDC051022]|uniref:MFS transporter n=1 Tax=Streptosporangium sp. NPDC051022 TaxID=3155752 RepID=UPI00341DBFEE
MFSPAEAFPAGPVRALALGTMFRTTGRGLFVTVSVLYLTRSVGLSVALVASAMTVAAAAGLAAALPAGHLADLRGPRNLTVVFAALEAVAIAGYCAVLTFTGLIVTAILVSVCETASLTGRSALIARSVPPQDRVRTRARLRVITNIGWSVGAGVAGTVLLHESRPGYLALICAAAACHLASALVTLRIPSLPPLEVAGKERGPRWVTLRDRPFLALTALNGVLCLHDAILNIAVPLWVVQYTRAPLSVVAWLFIVNTVIVVLLQVRLSRNTDTVRGAARAQRRAGALLTLSCAVYAWSANGSPSLAVVLLVVAAAVHALGEIQQSAGAWGISYELADEAFVGQYQGLYGMGVSIAAIAAPTVITTLLVGAGQPGWFVLGGLFLLSGMVVPVLAERASRRRTRAGERDDQVVQR